MVKLSVQHAWVWNPRARLHCDGNKIIFTIVVPSNVDVTNGGVHIATTLLDQKLPLLPQCEQGFTSANVYLYWNHLIAAQPCVRVNLLHDLHENILFEIFCIKR